jgi:hypothetical protein
MKQISESFKLTAARSAGIPSFLKNLAWDLNLQVEVEATKRFFLAEDISCRIRGAPDMVSEFKRLFCLAMSNYNQRIESRKKS